MEDTELPVVRRLLCGCDAILQIAPGQIPCERLGNHAPLAEMRLSWHHREVSSSHRMRSVALGICAITAILWLTAPGSRAAAQDNNHSARSAGCGKHAGTGKLKQSTLDGNKKTRTYLLEVPAEYDGSRPYSLTFVFHGAAGSSSDSYSWGLQGAAGAAASGIFVFPDGIAYKQYGIGWDDTNTGYDLPFFDNMLKELEAGYCIDSSRVFVAGFSWGGDFVIALACNRGDEIRAVAANSTNDEFKDTSNYLTYQNLPCPTHRHPPVRFQHAQDGDPVYPPPDFATTSKLFQYLNSCPGAAAPGASTPARSGPHPDSCVSYTGCSSEYIECSFDRKIGHALPPHWAADTWAFFTEHSK
jgi:pimeloyl-ACP methyl ester carboxylesterase